MGRAARLSKVAIVLPPRESFSPEGAGAIALLARRIARAPSRFEQVVVGRPVAGPFVGVPFVAAREARLPAPDVVRYAVGAGRAVWRLRPALAEVHNRPEVARALVRQGAPVMLFLHNDPRDMRGMRGGLRGVARTVAISAWLRGRLATEAVVLPNCIELAGIPASPEPREQTILFAGRVVADKGADAFVAACRRALPLLPGWRAEMIGADRFGIASPETWFLEELRPAASVAGVVLAGWRPHAEVLAAMARAAIVAVPSRWNEPFGMTALEAMACGAAVVFAPRGGLPEVVGEAGVAIDPDDPAGFAAGLVGLARDPARRAALGAAARARAAGFDVGPAMARLDALREEVLATWGVRDPI